MSTADGPFPTIDPTTFDVVLVGTGLPSSLLAAAAASNGHSVLHVDPNPFYGSHFSTLDPPSLISSLLHPPLFSHVSTRGDLPEPSRTFLLDASGPRLLYCADPLVDLMLRSGASHHVEFKSLDASLILGEGGLLSPVPDSREAIFKDKGLGLKEKGLMMGFLKMVRGHFEAVGRGETEGRITDEELEVPFSEFLAGKGLPRKIQSIVLYAIAMVDWEQESSTDESRKLMKTKEGLERLALYNSSVGRFPNAVGAFIYPIYGHGELPQAFCRCAAVKGALYVLRMPVSDMLVSEENRQYKGVRLANGQDILCSHIVVDPSFTTPSSVFPNSSEDCMGGTSQEKSGSTSRVARMVCITRHSVKPDLSNILVVFPPKSLHPEQKATVRALQLSSNLAVCPASMFVLYLSTWCQDPTLGKDFLHAALNALHMDFNVDPTSSDIDSGKVEEYKSDIIWSVDYSQEMGQILYGNLFSCPMPDANLDYGSILDSSIKMFQEMYPNEAFLPEHSAADNDEDEDSLD